MNNPCHKNRIASLKRIEGQIKGVIGMIESGEYCVDILNQTKAVRNALIAVETKIMETHLSNCVQESFENPDTRSEKIKELIEILKRQ
jgi:DNA-binding FrmR family transcriptional regulator